MQRAGTSYRVLIVDLVTRPVRHLEKGPLASIELQPERLHGDLEVRRLRSTHDRNIVVGTARDPGHRNVRRAHAPAHRHLPHAACDLAIAGERARFGLSGVNFGLFCSTPLVAVGRAIPRKRAMEMALTGRLYSAAEAERFGLVNRVVPEGHALEEAEARRAQSAPAPNRPAGFRTRFR